MGRDTCHQCFRIRTLCLCSKIAHFEIEPLIVLLVHPKEFMRTVGTVRIVKLSLNSSLLWRGRGADFDQDQTMQAILQNPAYYPMVLFPGEDSLNLSLGEQESIQSKIPKNRRLVIFVIDGTWTTAKQIIRESQQLLKLPKISFQVDKPSQYGFRKQPKEYCLSTVEAVSLLIQNLKEKNLCAPQPENGHLKMLAAFSSLVDSQMERAKL